MSKLNFEEIEAYVRSRVGAVLSDAHADRIISLFKQFLKGEAQQRASELAELKSSISD